MKNEDEPIYSRDEAAIVMAQLRAERDAALSRAVAAEARVEAVKVAVYRWDEAQSEWLIDSGGDSLTIYCGACDSIKQYGHTKDCPRMALRAALASVQPDGKETR